MKQWKMFLVASVLIYSSIFAQWEADQRLTNTPTSTFLASNNAWNVSASGDTVHAVFMEYEYGPSFIYYTHSYDGGASWSTPVMLGPQDTCSLLYYTLTASGSFVHVVWVSRWENKLIYCRSVNAGITWTSPAVIVNPGIHNVDSPCLAVNGNNVYLTWTHNPSGNMNSEIYFQRSSDYGANWSTVQRLTNTAANIIDRDPSIAAFGNYIHLVWQRGPDYGARVMYLRSINNGTSWEPEQFITNDTVNQHQPCLAVSGSYIYVVWTDVRTDTVQIFYRSSQDNGVNWQLEKNLSNGFSADYQTIAAIGRNVHVAWRDYRFNQQWHIGYRYSHDIGQTWSNDTVLNDLWQQEGPSIAVAGTKVHLIWNDNRDGNWEIYYKRNPTGSGIEENRNSLSALRSSLEVYPNPARTFLTIRYPYSTDRVKVFDISGKIVREILCSTQNDKSVRIPLDGIKSGIYFIQVDNFTHKFIITE